MNYSRVSFLSSCFLFCSFGLSKLLGGSYNGYYYAAWLCAGCAYRFASHSYVYMSSERFREICDVIAFMVLLLVVSVAIFCGNLQYHEDLYNQTYFPKLYATPLGVMP